MIYHYRRNSDADLRNAERRYEGSIDPLDRQKLLLERLRVGLLRPECLHIASLLGHPLAQVIDPTSTVDWSDENIRQGIFQNLIDTQHQLLVVHVLCAFTRRILPRWEDYCNTAGLADNIRVYPQLIIGGTLRWTEDPSEKNRRAIEIIRESFPPPPILVDEVLPPAVRILEEFVISAYGRNLKEASRHLHLDVVASLISGANVETEASVALVPPARGYCRVDRARRAAVLLESSRTGKRATRDRRTLLNSPMALAWQTNYLADSLLENLHRVEFNIPYSKPRNRPLGPHSFVLEFSQGTLRIDPGVKRNEWHAKWVSPPNQGSKSFAFSRSSLTEAVFSGRLNKRTSTLLLRVLLDNDKATLTKRNLNALSFEAEMFHYAERDLLEKGEEPTARTSRPIIFTLHFDVMGHTLLSPEEHEIFREALTNEWEMEAIDADPRK